MPRGEGEEREGGRREGGGTEEEEEVEDEEEDKEGVTDGEAADWRRIIRVSARIKHILLSTFSGSFVCDDEEGGTCPG